MRLKREVSGICVKSFRKPLSIVCVCARQPCKLKNSTQSGEHLDILNNIKPLAVEPKKL